MSLIDWALVVVPTVLMFYLVIRIRKYSRTVADFLVGGRTGGRYLLTAANGIAGMGLISLVAIGQRFYHSGWAFEWWNIGLTVFLTILMVSGFVTYRYRETRVMTLAQFFEIRYSRKFRITMGFICWMAGIINFGIFPAVGANFFICFLGLPQTLGGIPTFPLLMILFLGMACFVLLNGGQVQNMMTDTLQMLLVYVMCIAVAITVICLFTVDELRGAFLNRPDGMSYVNPFDTEKIGDFNFWYFLIMLYALFAHRGAWQGNQGYSGSALSPHEAKMGGILSTWRQLTFNLFNIMFCLGGSVLLFSDKYKGFTAGLTEKLNSFLSPAVVDQMLMPIAFAEQLPIGIKGMFAAVLFFFMLSTDTTYIHSWGTILIQDVVLPVYGKEISQKTHLLLLKSAMIFVAVFAFFFSLYYTQSEYIAMFQMLTGVIFAASAGSAIIGGLYWRKATVAGAWASAGVGTVVALFFVLLLDSHCWAFFREFLLNFFPDNQTLLKAVNKCPLNGAWLSFIATILAQAVFAAVSFATCRKEYDLDKLLHRGAYSDGEKKLVNTRKISTFKRIFFGFDEEFTLRDKIIASSVAVWNLGWGAFFILVTLWNVIGYCFPNPYIRMWTEEGWFNYLLAYCGILLVITPLTAVWLLWGGCKDLRTMFRLLRDGAHSEDDGFVSDKKD